MHVDVTTGGYLPRLRTLAYKAKTVVEETGANNLYLALGSLVWELDGRPLRSPLVLVPVDAHPAGRAGAYRLTARRVRREHAELLPAGEAAPAARPRRPGAGRARRRRGIDLDAALRGDARRAGRRTGCPTGSRRRRTWRSCSSRSSGCGRTSTSTGPSFAENPLVAHLVHAADRGVRRPGRATPADSVDLDELAARCPLPADASQLRAVAEAAAGRTFVLEGPPGTGKSQTITNLLTRAVAEGKRVLFVAEKRAALDVVARRLDAVGMGPFALDLHDKGSRAVDGAGADPAGAGARGRRRRAGAGRRRRGPALGPPRCWPATPTGCTTTNAAGLSLYSARTAELAAGTDVRAAAGAAAVRRQRARPRC